jgi:hypothetical protein
MVLAAKRLIAIVGCTLLGLLGSPAEAKTDGQQRVVERARLALDSFLDDPNFEYMRVYVQNAYAVLVVPETLKAGFLFGAEYGVGVLLVRDPQSGNWGQPAFYSVYGGSFGFQIGGSMSDTVFAIMNEGAVDKLIAHKVKFGGDSSPTTDLVTSWVTSTGLRYSDADEDANFEACMDIGDQITAAFVRECCDTVCRLHASGAVTAIYGRSIPLLVHELEYYDEIAEQNKAANPPGVCDEFALWVRGE